MPPRSCPYLLDNMGTTDTYKNLYKEFVMRSVMEHQFSQVPQAEIQRSSFDRSHGYKTTFDAGYLVPFYIDEALPGDTFNCRTTIFARLATPIAPIMDNLRLSTFFFSVPLRLIWSNFQKFMGEQENPNDSTDFLVPQILSPVGGWPVGSLSDYFGLPTGIDNLSVSAFWHRAYNLIYNEWFRDENLQDSVPVHKDDGPDPDSDYVLLRRGKRHDYFTSCLPWPQKGPGVDVPLGGNIPVSVSGNLSVPVVGNGEPISFIPLGSRSSGFQVGTPMTGQYDNPGQWPPATSGYFRGGTLHVGPFGSSVNDSNLVFSNPVLGESATVNNVSSNYLSIYSTDNAPNPKVGATVVGFNPQASSLVASGNASLTGTANLSSATAVTINTLREAFQLQRLLERDARGGTRYTEILRSHFGVTSPDARLQRPEYLGGSVSHISINPVTQNSSTDSVTPQGNLAAYGVCADDFHGFTHSFVEHCVVLGLVSVQADLTYQQGINRMFSRQTRYDFYWPTLAHLGEQAVLNKEIYAQGTSEDDEVFGYQERYGEYRYYPSQITGKFRSTFAQSLDVWHLSQKFDNLPKLNGAFIEDNPPIDRVIAVPSEPHILFDSYISLNCVRPMPVFSVPGLIDHF